MIDYSNLEMLNMETIFTASKMTNRKYIILEGIDDIKKYEFILEKSTKVTTDVLDRFIKICPIELILDYNGIAYSPDCKGVISALDDIVSENPNEMADMRTSILGIIDKDVRNHREHIEPYPNNMLLYVLPFYSIESFYVNPYSTKLILDLLLGSCTIVSSDLIDDIYQKSLNATIDELNVFIFYSLKKATTPSFTDERYGYSFEYGYIKNNQHKFEESNIDSNELQRIKEKNIFYDVCKGKWMLECWLEKTIDNIKNLSQKCKNNEIKQCTFCIKNTHDKCLYKIKGHNDSNKNIYYQILFKDQDFLKESYRFKDIINRFDEMFLL